MDFWLIFAIIFILGTIILARTKAERHFIIFLIRIKRFLNLIDRIAEIFPKFWRFLSDSAILFSFSGIGAAYLSRYKESCRNLINILIPIGLISILLWSRDIPSVFEIISQNIFFIPALVVLLVVVVFALHKSDEQTANFLSATLLISSIGLKIFPNYNLAMFEGLFGIPALLLIAFIQHSYDIILGQTNIPGVSPMLPGTREGEIGVLFPGTGIFIPGSYALIALVVTVVVHELAHGILARVHKIELKSTGLLTLGILPIGAFVEPDEKELEKRQSIEKMQIFAMGSFANLLVGVTAFMLILAITPISGSLVKSDGMLILDVTGGYPAEGILKSGMVIYEVNGKSARTAELFMNATSTLKPGDEISLLTNEGEFRLKTTNDPENESRAVFGISLTPNISLIVKIIMFIKTAIFWIFFFNINIALVNLLPIAPFDGGRMIKEVMLTFDIREKTAKNIIYGILAFTLILFLINTFPLFHRLIDYIQNLTL